MCLTSSPLGLLNCHHPHQQQTNHDHQSGHHDHHGQDHHNHHQSNHDDQVASKDLKMYGSPWSAPAWMKSNNALNGQVSHCDFNKLHFRMILKQGHVTVIW